jgi:hypothetical protein
VDELGLVAENSLERSGRSFGPSQTNGRRLLQSNASPFRHRLHQPDRDGAKSSLTLSIFSGEDQTVHRANSNFSGKLGIR